MRGAGHSPQPGLQQTQIPDCQSSFPGTSPAKPPGKAPGQVPGVTGSRNRAGAWPGLWELQLWALFPSSCPARGGGGAASELGLKGILGSFPPRLEINAQTRAYTAAFGILVFPLYLRQLNTRRVTPVTDALFLISKLRFSPFPSPDTPFPLNHSRCLLQKLPKSAAALGDQPRAAGREQKPGGLQTDGSSRGSSSEGLKAGTHRSCALGNRYPWMTPKCILILPRLHFYQAELSSQLGLPPLWQMCHLCLAGLGGLLAGHLSPGGAATLSVTVQKMGV